MENVLIIYCICAVQAHYNKWLRFDKQHVAISVLIPCGQPHTVNTVLHDTRE